LIASTDDRVRFVDEEDDRFGRTFDLRDDLLHAVLEFALHACAGLKKTKIETHDLDALKEGRNLVVHDHERHAFNERGFTNAAVANDDRVVLSTTTEDVDHLSNLALATEDGIDLASTRTTRVVDAVFGKRRVSRCARSTRRQTASTRGCSASSA
jgi:hypothetical protein